MKTPGREVLLSAIFRDGFYRDFIIVILVSIIIGATFSSRIAWALDSHFGDTIKQMVGSWGIRFDLMCMKKQESALRT